MNATKRLESPFFRSSPRVSLSDRRTSNRGPVQSKAQFILTDPSGGKRSHDILTRQSSTTSTFLLREPLSIGQTACIAYENGFREQVEVVRTRAISAGRHEITVEVRKTPPITPSNTR